MSNEVSRNSKLMLTTTSSLVFQVVTVICGFILPRLILESYGSEVNGLVSSIQQFLQIIAFMELGVGAVVKSSLYKPLAENNSNKVSEIIGSATRFFRRLAVILLFYVAVLTAFYPLFSDHSFDWGYTALLIAAMSISYFAQYYFGITNQLLLTADQRGYIIYITQTVTLIANTIACAILIKAGGSIQLVKLTTSLIYLVRPLVLKIYVEKNYQITRHIKYDKEPIQQKWNGVAQHIAAIVLDSTDIVVLTVLANLSEVSIYYVYHLVVNGVKQMFLVVSNGIQAVLGELWAKQKIDELNDMFGWIEWLLHTAVVFLFGCTGILIVPFVSVYTRGINDVNYVVPVFAALITLANAVHCLRIPYNMLVLAAGHYKQTQTSYVVSAAINVVISIVTVRAYGLVGVAIGTLAGMAYHAIWMAMYVSKNLIKWPVSRIIRQCAVDIVTVLILYAFTRWLPLRMTSYSNWLMHSFITVIIAVVTILAINYIFYKNRLRQLFKKLLRKGQRL